MHCRTYVSAFALTVYWHDPDGTPMVLLGSRAPPRGGAESDFLEPYIRYILGIYIAYTNTTAQPIFYKVYKLSTCLEYTIYIQSLYYNNLACVFNAVINKKIYA